MTSPELPAPPQDTPPVDPIETYTASAVEATDQFIADGRNFQQELVKQRFSTHEAVGHLIQFAYAANAARDTEGGPTDTSTHIEEKLIGPYLSEGRSAARHLETQVEKREKIKELQPLLEQAAHIDAMLEETGGYEAREEERRDGTAEVKVFTRIVEGGGRSRNDLAVTITKRGFNPVANSGASGAAALIGTGLWTKKEGSDSSLEVAWEASDTMTRYSQPMSVFLSQTEGAITVTGGQQSRGLPGDVSYSRVASKNNAERDPARREFVTIVDTVEQGLASKIQMERSHESDSRTP